MKKEYELPKNYKPDKNPMMPGGVDYEIFIHAMQREHNLVQIAKHWRNAFCFSMLIMVASVGFNYWQSTQSKLIPYLIEVDNTGYAKAVGLMNTEKYIPKEAEIEYFLFQFVSKFRTIPTDRVVLKRNGSEALHFLEDSAKNKANNYLKKEFNEKLTNLETVSVELVSINKVAGTKNSYHIRWTEKIFTQNGELKATNKMFGNFIIDIKVPKDKDVLKVNPLGIYISDLSWSKES